MSLDLWLKRGRKVQVGGRELILMPLPLSKLVAIGHWLEENSNEVIQEVVEEIKRGKDAPNPMSLITKVCLKVSLASIVLNIFETPKDPLTGKPINKDLTEEFFDAYLDIPTAHDLVLKFVEVNQLEDLIKNLSRLPIVKKLIEALTLAYGTPYLNSLQPNTDSAQTKLEGSRSPRSTDTSQPAITEKPGSGNSTSQNLEEKSLPSSQNRPLIQ